MAANEEYIDLKDAKKIVLKTIKEYGSLGYSRLLMSTVLPQNILDKSLELLIRDRVLTCEDDVDPRYHLTWKGLFWNFS